MKNLINDEDFVCNPETYVLDDKLPTFYLSKSDDELKTARGCFNYGVFLATKFANQKAAPILEAIVTYFTTDKNEEEHEKAFNKLKEIVMNYGK